jgi:hypothetical protein
MTTEDTSTNRSSDESLTEIQIEQKKSTPKFVNPSDKKTYGQVREFIEEGMVLQANYQLVMMKYLVAHKIAHKGQIAEELAFYNNQDNSDIEVVKKFFKVPVYEVLEKRGL